MRHPNVVKYLYSEEPHHNLHHNNLKCLLITEYIRPLSTLIDSLNIEQIMHGIYGITNALNFLHEKAKMSHNNLSKSSIYVNGKQVWKLSDFEFSLSFSNLNCDNLREIYEFKQKNSITPEEEINYRNSNQSNDLNKIYKLAPHSIDAYGWAMTVLSILPNSSINKNEKNSFRTFFGEHNDLVTNPVVEKLDTDLPSLEFKFDNSFEQLELYLNKEPTERPTLKSALNIKLFDLYKIDDFFDESSIEFELFQIDNLEDLELNYEKLIEYLMRLNKEQMNLKINEQVV